MRTSVSISHTHDGTCPQLTSGRELQQWTVDDGETC